MTSNRTITELYQALRPLLLRDVAMAVGGSGSAAVGMETHALSGNWHTGTLAETQAPWAATKNEWATALASHAALPDVHHAAVTAGTLIGLSGQQVSLLAGSAQYQVPVTGASPFAPAWTALENFAGNGMIWSAGAFNVTVSGLGLGVGVNAVTLTSSSNPGAAASILASDTSGYLSLVRLTLADRLYASLVETASGSLTLSPAGAGVLPSGTIQKDLGDYNRKWRTLYAGELYVETLVAQNVIATIGGRVMVAPTSQLIADAASGATTIDVKHNVFAVNDYLYLAAAPGGVAQVEVMLVTAGPTTITDGYRYTVTRNVDGSGVNGWMAGDAVVLLREGYIDLTATSTALNHLGPTIATYARSSASAWNSLTPTTAQGNLRSFVDYGSNVYGFALGNDLTLTPSSGFKGMTADPTNGLRLFNANLTEYSGATPVLSLNQATGMDIAAYNESSGGGITDPVRKVRWLTSIGGNEVASLYGNVYSGSDEFYLRMMRAAATQHVIQFDAIRMDYGWAQFFMNSWDGTGSRVDLTADSVNLSAGIINQKAVSLNVDVSQPWIRGALRIGGTAYANGSTVWHAGNDGAGSGLDADLLRGLPQVAVGNNFGAWTSIGDGGVMEIGKYIDFHETDGGTEDYTHRIWSNNGELNTSGDFHVNGRLLADTVGYDWSELTPSGGWNNSGGSNATFGVKRFGNLVSIKGVLSASGAIASNTSIYTLASMYRPSATRQFACYGTPGAVRVAIFSDGTIRPQAAFSANDYLCVEITYFTGG